METIRGLNTNGPTIIVTGVVFTVLAVAAVGLRFTSKRITSAGFGVDDWLLLVSLLIYITAEILVIRSDIVGRESVSPDDNRYTIYLQYVYIYSVFYFPVIAFVEASILFFYRRVFFPSHIRYTSIVLAAVCAAWCITACVIEIGYPSHAISYYFPGSTGTTFNVTYLTFWLAMAIIEVLIEITILVLPIREIHRLQLSRKKKYLLSLIFALGGFVIITAIIRMSILYRPGQTDLDLTQGDIWLNVHLGTAIISACIPTYRPLVSRSSQLLQGFHSRHASYPTDDTHILTTVKKRMHGSRLRRPTEDIYMEQEQDHQGSFVDAHRSESNNTTKLVWREDGVVRTEAAIGVKQTVEFV